MALIPRYANSYALVIGINEYSNEPPLSYAKNDAVAVSEILIRKFGFQKKNVNLLLDKKATQKAILHNFWKLAQTEENDRVLIFFAGRSHYQIPKRRCWFLSSPRWLSGRYKFPFKMECFDRGSGTYKCETCIFRH